MINSPLPVSPPPGQALTLDKALEHYQTIFLASRNLAQRSRREYTDDIGDLVEFLEDQCRIRTPDRVERAHLEGYLAELDRRGMASSTRRRKVASIRSFFAFLEDREMVLQSPARKLIPPAREYLQPRVLTEGEYRRLLDAVRGEIRDGAVIELLLQTGMRLSEIARLTPNNIDLPAEISKDEGNVGSVLILGKRRKSRTVTLNWKACRAVLAYLQIRPKVDDQQLFITKFGSGMSPRAIEYLVDKYLKLAGIRSASVHTLRHTFGTQMVKKGTKLEIVRQVLGHADVKTTAIYVQLAREVMDKELQQNAL